MANRPTTLADLRREQGPPQARGPRAGGMHSLNVDAPAPARNEGGRGGGRSGRRLFGGMDGVQEKHPRNEHYGDMWTTTFCPNFTIWSFTFLNVLLQLIIFIATLIYTS